MNYMNAACKEFTEMKPETIFEEPLLYTSYVAVCEGHESAYLPTKGMDHLKGVLEAKLEEYNESVANMNLVLLMLLWNMLAELQELLIYLVEVHFL